MEKYSEETLNNWRKPASESEEQKISNAISMIKEAVKLHDSLNGSDIEFIVQGSYGNNTNVKLESDIDICAMFKSTFFTEYRDGASDMDYGFHDGAHSFLDYRSYVIEAMYKKFGNENITVGNKSIKIKSNTYRVQADVVPAFQYRNYRNDKNNDIHNFVEGIKFITSNGESIVNYPKIHIKNGVSKNAATSRKYKRTIRLFKKIRNIMIEEGLPIPNSINSFLIEGLLWNTPNTVFSSITTWNELLQNSLIHQYNNTDSDVKCKNWGEVSEYFYLFHSSRKWSRADVNNFLLQMWNYLGYSK